MRPLQRPARFEGKPAASGHEKRAAAVGAMLILLATTGFAQFDEVWEQEIEDPAGLAIVGIANTDNMPGPEIVTLGFEYRIDRANMLRILDAATGEEQWTSDQFYYIYDDSTRGPRIQDVDGDSIAEIMILAEYDPGYPLWFLFKFHPSGSVGEGSYRMSAMPRLGQTLPNPVHGSSRIEYTLPREMAARLLIYDGAGRCVRALVSGKQLPGKHLASWDCRNDQGRAVAPGTYYYVLEADRSRETRKAVVVR
jgi:hypothetical protein